MDYIPFKLNKINGVLVISFRFHFTASQPKKKIYARLQTSQVYPPPTTGHVTNKIVLDFLNSE
jgi:hypothetical protein